MKAKYPKTYRKVEQRLESGWEKTIALISQGMEDGIVRPVNVQIVKMMLEASIEQFFARDILIRNGLTYQEALDEVVRVIVDGIIVRPGKETA